jgi:molecular chaperone GrpE
MSQSRDNFRSVESEMESGPDDETVASSLSSAAANEQGEIGELERQLADYRDRALRAIAELDNYRKRVAREKEDSIRYANAAFLERLIPILDNFELGLQAARSGTGESAVLQGMSMVYKQLQDFLSSSGVDSIEAEGKHFDPNLHEAIAQEEHADLAEGMVVRQVRRGYKLRDRLIRPANVIVAKAPANRNVAATAGQNEGR